MKARMNSDEMRLRPAARDLRWLRLAVTLLACDHVLSATAGTGKVPSAGGTPPVIDEQPIGRTATAGGHVTLSVLAHGTAPLAFQWFANFGDTPLTNSARLTGATNAVLNIDPALTSDSSQYSVLVSSTNGSVFSTYAGVVVNPLLTQFGNTGATGAVVVLTGQVGDVYRVELNVNFTGYKTNGYATNLSGSVSYTVQWPNDQLFRQLRVAVDRMLPVLYPRDSQGLAAGFRAYGKLNQIWRIDGATSLPNWVPILTVTNTTGWVKFSDPALQPPMIRFYRIAPP